MHYKKNIFATPIGVYLIAFSTAGACAADAASTADTSPAEGSLGRLLFGEDFGATSDIKLGGWLEVGAVLKDRKGQAQGLGNSPVALARDSGLQLNQFYLFLEKGIQSNIIPRVTPTPAPAPENYSFGFHIDALYGRDGQPIQSSGWDYNWKINNPGNQNPTRAQQDRQNFLVMPQAYLQAYLPWGLGTTVMAGNFMSPIGNEIGFHPQPGPNIFYSRTYSFAAAPIKHTGLLVDTNVLQSKDYGLLAAEFGIVNGWSNFKDQNNKPAYLGALRYRTPDMATWIDYEFMTGDAESPYRKLAGDPTGRDANIPITRVFSPRGQNKIQHFLTLSHDWNQKWHAQIGVHYGRQKGDGAADTQFFPTQMQGGFTGATWKGAEARLKYAFSDKFSIAGRVEHFQDRDGFALFPNTLVKSDFNAVTVGAQYWINKHLLFRPEVRHDWQSHNQGVKAFNHGTSERQTSLNADMVFYF